jgi:hypothetical protein
VKDNPELFLGDGFFNRYYTYFDIGALSVGIARNKEVLSYYNVYRDNSKKDREDKEFYSKLH